MLELRFPEKPRAFDEELCKYVTYPEIVIQIEHSLYAIRLWESKWKVPFATRKEFSPEEFLYYVICMTVHPEIINPDSVDPAIYLRLLDPDCAHLLEKIRDYLADPHCATTIKDRPGGKKEVITAAIVYYYMSEYNIPYSCERWNFNELMMQIRVHSEKQQPPKKMSKADTAAYYRKVNAAHRKK